MTFSLKTKLLVMCILLVLLTTASISISYYGLTKQDKHRESQQRIQIGFDIIFDDYQSRITDYTTKVKDFLQKNAFMFGWSLEQYMQDNAKLGSPQFIASDMARMATALEELGYLLSANRLMLYASDDRLISAYLQDDSQRLAGVYARSSTGSDTYLPVSAPSQLMTMILLGDQNVPDKPLPPDIPALYSYSEIPDSLRVEPFSDGRRLGIRFTVPTLYEENIFGVLVGDIFYTPEMISRYAALSKTDINIFAGTRLGVGTLDIQQELKPEQLAAFSSCPDMLTEKSVMRIASIAFDEQNEQEYYQGQCAFRNSNNEEVGAITVSLSQFVERQEIRKILTSVLTISGIVVCLAFVLSLFFSQSTLRAIQNIVSVIGYAAEGDLRNTAVAATRDEIEMLANKLNQMIEQLRTISGRVQEAASAVNGTADTILRQMDGLVLHMKEQSAHVDATTESVEHITRFIQTVSQNMLALLDTSELVLSSIQQTHSSVEEVTASTKTLVVNLQLIVSSIDQVSSSVKQISDSVGQLEDIARQSETEVQHIDNSFQDVSQNARQAQQLAQETMDAALHGQTSVEDSIQGMAELKIVVADTAEIIQEVNTWGAQVSSILDIVDEITEQTSLLALNASIISAQAGSHGRGFAVVADEIKNLAIRTKSSTKEIGSLVHQLQMKTEEGVKNTEKGLLKADQGVQLANAVKEALETILDSATRSSTRAGDTAQVVQQTAESSQIIRSSMTRVTEMVSHIRQAIQEQEQDMDKVVAAVENISGMAEQVNRASVEQRKTADQIMSSMEDADQKFRSLSSQTTTLQQNSAQIMGAIRMIESTTKQTLESATSISGDTVKSLVQQSEMLQKLVSIFKIS